MRDDSGEYAFRGCFHDVRPGELIVQTFTFEGEPDGVLAAGRCRCAFLYLRGTRMHTRLFSPAGGPLQATSCWGLLAELMQVILDTSDLSTATIADRLGTGSAHLLPVVVVEGGRRVGGYSVVVAA